MEVRHPPRRSYARLHRPGPKPVPVGLPSVVALTELYANVPMDFADATLVLLAEALDAHHILTLDRRGFSTYRTRAGRGLRLVLDG